MIVYNPNSRSKNDLDMFCPIFRTLLDHKLVDNDMGRCQTRRFQADLMLQIDVHEEIDGSLVVSLYVSVFHMVFERSPRFTQCNMGSYDSWITVESGRITVFSKIICLLFKNITNNNTLIDISTNVHVMVFECACFSKLPGMMTCPQLMFFLYINGFP